VLKQKSCSTGAALMFYEFQIWKKNPEMGNKQQDQNGLTFCLQGFLDWGI
jgi:hypothetical protein